MTNQHPITPPPELVQQWWTEFERTEPDTDSLVFIATQAARWGADQELEACCEYMQHEDFHGFAKELRAARRPQPPSLKKQALATLQKLSKDGYPCNYQDDKDWATIRRALEQLDD